MGHQKHIGLRDNVGVGSVVPNGRLDVNSQGLQLNDKVGGSVYNELNWIDHDPITGLPEDISTKSTPLLPLFLR